MKKKKDVCLEMYNYVICSIFWILFTIFLCIMGRQFCGKKIFSSALISGYVFYSLLVGIGGIIVQMLNLPWTCFAVFMAVLWFALLICVLLSFKRRKFVVNKKDIKCYIQNNWILYLTLAALAGISLLYYAGFWLGNHQDDGYYITKVATLPYTQTGGNFNYPLGIAKSGFNSYVVNTWEIEASVYVHLLKVSSTLYLRLFQSMFVFFLYLNLIKCLTERVICYFKLEIKESLIQLPVTIVLLFDMHYLFLQGASILKLRDMFMVNTGMFLGSSVVRLLGVPLFIYACVEREKLFRKLIGMGVISIVLISKSTIALPLIVIMLAAMFIVWLVFDNGKRGRYCAFAFSAIYMLAAVILPNKMAIQDAVWSDARQAVSSYAVIVCMVIFACSFALRNQLIYRINIIIGLMGILQLVPQVNDLFENLCVYSFVGGRAVTSWIYFFIIVNVIYLLLILLNYKLKDVWIKGIYSGVAVTLMLVMLVGFKMFGGGVLLDQPRVEGGIRGALAAIKNNPYFMPASTEELGNKLDELSDLSAEQIHAVTPKMIVMDGALHPLSVMLRIYAPEVIPVSAAERYPADEDSFPYGYVQREFEAFETSPSDETADRFWDEIRQLDINCIVVRNDKCGYWLEEKNFELYDEVEGFYYIWYKQ